MGPSALPLHPNHYIFDKGLSFCIALLAIKRKKNYDDDDDDDEHLHNLRKINECVSTLKSLSILQKHEP